MKKDLTYLKWNTLKHIMCLILINFSLFSAFSQGAAFNSTGAAADPSAALDISSSTQGILIPRMTEAQKNTISSPATGLMIYQTDGTSGFWYWDGVTWTQPGTSGPAHYIGELYGGGVIYFVYDNGNHGLILSLTESNQKWQNSPSATGATSTWDGVSNTNLMTNSPAQTYAQSLGPGWYIPAIDDLSYLYDNKYALNIILKSIPGATLLNARYWASTESTANSSWAWTFPFWGTGSIPADGFDKVDQYVVRAIKAF